MLIEATLLAIWAAICTFDLFSFQTSLYRPLIAGSITGLILGDFQQGLVIGATLELMWLGVTGIGAYVPPDVISGSIIGTAVGIISGQGSVAGIAIAVPVAVVCQQLDILARTFAISFTHKADKLAEEGDIDGIDKCQLIGFPMYALTRAVPVFLAIFFGADFVENIFSYVPEVVMNGLTVSGAILPALGFGMLLSLMLNKKLWVFMLLGFACAIYGNIPTVGLAIIGVIVAVLYDMFTRKDGKVDDDTSNNLEVETSEGGYDL